MKKIADYSWVFMLLAGILILIYAYDNIVTIPNLDPNDSERGWEWLTTDEDVVEYIKFIFRFLGLWILFSGITTIAISLTGYRTMQQWAWWSLLYLPLHLILLTSFTPWILPIMAPVITIVLIGLIAPAKKFLGKSS